MGRRSLASYAGELAGGDGRMPVDAAHVPVVRAPHAIEVLMQRGARVSDRLIRAHERVVREAVRAAELAVRMHDAPHLEQAVRGDVRRRQVRPPVRANDRV